MGCVVDGFGDLMYVVRLVGRGEFVVVKFGVGVWRGGFISVFNVIGERLLDGRGAVCGLDWVVRRIRESY